MDKYGYIGIETLLNSCDNSKDHAVTPNDFMRMNRVKMPERPKGKWIVVDDAYNRISGKCSVCGWEAHMYEDDVVGMNYCPNCGADMRG